MEKGLGIWRCVQCGTGFFPERFLCPECRSAEFSRDRVHQGVIEEITTIRHVIGQNEPKLVKVASVRTSDGQLVLAGLRSELDEGHAVDLFEESRAAFAVKPGTSP